MGTVQTPAGYLVFDWFDRFTKGSCSGDGAYRGIDVSQWQGVIDWASVKAAGVDYAIIRCGYGDDWTSQDDPQWINNVQGCLANGIPFGVYIYSYATDTSMAQSEADHTLRLLAEAGLSPAHLSYPVYFDMEDGSTVGADLATIASVYCQRIEAAGYEAGVYASLNWWNNKLTASCFDNWHKWVAAWNADTVGLTYGGFSDFATSKGMWQFSDYGVVPGIAGRVDLNYTYLVPFSRDLVYASASPSGMTRNYTGAALSPTATVRLSGQTLVAGRDYELRYESTDGTTYPESAEAPSAAGTYTVTARGIGGYVGSRVLGTFTIIDAGAFTTQTCHIVSASNSSFVLDAAEAQPVRGSNVSVWSSNGGANQAFTLAPDGNGYYVIHSYADAGLVLDAAGATPVIGANVSVWTENGGMNQKWVLVPAGDGSYKIASASNPTFVLDAAGATPSIGANVSVWTDNGGANQRWQFIEANDLSFASVSPSGMAHNCTGAALSPTVTVRLSGQTLVAGHDYELWYEGTDGTTYPAGPDAPSAAGNYTVTVRGIGNYEGSQTVSGIFTLYDAAVSASVPYRVESASNPAFVLDAAEAQPVRGSNVSVWTDNGGVNQVFTFVPDGNGYYVIHSYADSNLVLDAAGATPVIGANVSVWTDNGGMNQKWVLVPAGDGTFKITSAANPTFVLDAAGAVPEVGANVSVWTANGGANQRWTVRLM